MIELRSIDVTDANGQFRVVKVEIVPELLDSPWLHVIVGGLQAGAIDFLSTLKGGTSDENRTETQT